MSLQVHRRPQGRTVSTPGRRDGLNWVEEESNVGSRGVLRERDSNVLNKQRCPGHEGQIRNSARLGVVCGGLKMAGGCRERVGSLVKECGKADGWSVGRRYMR
jgi:hypothetical protein